MWKCWPNNLKTETNPILGDRKKALRLSCKEVMKEMTTRYKKSDLESYKEFKKLRKLGNNRPLPPRRSEWMSNESTLFFIHNNSPAFVAIESSMRVYVYSW